MLKALLRLNSTTAQKVNQSQPKYAALPTFCCSIFHSNNPSFPRKSTFENPTRQKDFFSFFIPQETIHKADKCSVKTKDTESFGIHIRMEPQKMWHFLELTWHKGVLGDVGVLGQHGEEEEGDEPRDAADDTDTIRQKTRNNSIQITAKTRKKRGREGEFKERRRYLTKTLWETRNAPRRTMSLDLATPPLGFSSSSMAMVPTGGLEREGRSTGRHCRLQRRVSGGERKETSSAAASIYCGERGMQRGPRRGETLIGGGKLLI